MTHRSDGRLAVLTADIARRLRGVCAHLPEPEFQALVQDIGLMKLRWEDTSMGDFDRRGRHTEREDSPRS
jgi:hypothetical protein